MLEALGCRQLTEHLVDREYNIDAVIALAYLGLGDRDEALRRLDRLRELGGNSLYLRLPAMAPLRELPQYKRAIRQVGVPD